MLQLLLVILLEKQSTNRIIQESDLNFKIRSFVNCNCDVGLRSFFIFFWHWILLLYHFSVIFYRLNYSSNCLNLKDQIFEKYRRLYAQKFHYFVFPLWKIESSGRASGNKQKNSHRKFNFTEIKQTFLFHDPIRCGHKSCYYETM